MNTKASLFKRYGVPVLEGVHCTSPDQALAAYDHLGSKVVAVKSQIPPGAGQRQPVRSRHG